MFDVWTHRVNSSSANVKDFYNSIKVKGLELTKALIKVCHYGNFVTIPTLAEGKLEKEEDIKDFKEICSMYIWSCWN